MELFSDYKFFRLVYNTAVVFVRQAAPADKELEAEMLTRLSLRLENDFNPKQKTREEIEKHATDTSAQNNMKI